MDYVADDVVAIKKRILELRAQKEEDYDPDRAIGPALDMIGRSVGLDRMKDESDYTYRVRVRAKLNA
jgi:hypothetical protein